MSTYNDASLIYYPSGYKASKAYSLKPTDGSGDLTFTRASTATRVNESGLIESVATGVPRIDYTGGGCGKLLLEPQRANVVLQSQEISVSPWSKGSGTILSNVEVSPDGTSNADKYVYGGSGTSVLLQSFTVASGSTYTASVWLKGDSNGIVIIGNGAGSVYQVKSVTTEWQRFEYQRTTTSTSESFAIFISGSTLSSVYVWGFQYELGNFKTSYIPTTTTAVTRVEDRSITTGLSSVIGQTEGTINISFVFNKSDGNKWIGIRRNAGVDERVLINVVGDKLGLWVTINGSNQIAASNLLTLTEGATYNVAVAYKFNDYKCYVNGTSVYTNITATAPTLLDGLILAANFGGPYYFTFPINFINLFPTRKSDTELATLTTL